MMHDHEVGELWRRANDSSVKPMFVLKLIRKIVEGRIALYDLSFPNKNRDENLRDALHDFGIDQATWTEE